MLFACLLASTQLGAPAREFHVSVTGNDSNRGTKRAALRTIQHAADLAQPGDVITVHEGVYRERIDPPRGGTSEKRRIVYQAAPGEKVEVKGSEQVKGWTKVQEEVWKVTLPNSFFGNFNPYTNSIHGDWFNPKNRPHHTGAVYLNGEWLVEAANLQDVLAPGTHSATGGDQDYLLNLAWFRPGGKITPAASFSAQQGVQTAPCSEGGECVGWIENGDWVRYDGFDFGPGAEQLEIRAASATEGGIIEVRLDRPDGQLLGSCAIPNTGDWQTWSSFNARITRTTGVQTLCLVFRNKTTQAAKAGSTDSQLWFAEVDEANTTIWAQFKGVSPNDQLVEINARQTVFFPDQPGRNYITVRRFALRQAATPWAPPTAGQVGLIGTHWSKGWVIEGNTISHSVCSGIALGKYGDQYDNTSADTAEGYVKTIERALQNGWNRETIGHHIVRNNTISHCEQAAIVGSLGAAFSTVTGNTIHDIHVRRLFTGAEMAGIKFHAAIDTTIRDNHIYRTCLGLWLDWMAQGTRVSANLFHDNARDLFVEVNHGPFVVDNNLFLSAANLLDVSEGGAFAHNLFFGKITSAPEPNRETPYHPAHSTTVAGLTNVKGGDCRFYNNIFVGRGLSTTKDPTGFGLSVYDTRPYPLLTGGNIYFNGAQPYGYESNCAANPADPKFTLTSEADRALLKFDAGAGFDQVPTRLVTTVLLGKAKVPGVAYENPDGSPLKIDRDFLGKRRHQKPTSGPFENLGKGQVALKLHKD